MPEPTELLAGAVKNLRNAIHPLTQPTPHWNNGDPRFADPLYTRMREALTATSLRTGATTTKSKPPARIDVLDWLTDIDQSTATWNDHPTTCQRLQAIADTTWTPNHLALVNAITRRCERWTHTAKDLLGDNPITVPLQNTRCPNCQQHTCYRRSGNEKLRQPALTVGETGAQCHACGRKWVSDTEQALFRRMLGINDTPDT